MIDIIEEFVEEEKEIYTTLKENADDVGVAQSFPVNCLCWLKVFPENEKTHTRTISLRVGCEGEEFVFVVDDYRNGPRVTQAPFTIRGVENIDSTEIRVVCEEDKDTGDINEKV